MKRNSALLPLFVGLLCLPCILVPLLITFGLGSVFALIFPYLTPVVIIVSLTGFIAYIMYRQYRKTN